MSSGYVIFLFFYNKGCICKLFYFCCSHVLVFRPLFLGCFRYFHGHDGNLGTFSQLYMQ